MSAALLRARLNFATLMSRYAQARASLYSNIHMYVYALSYYDNSTMRYGMRPVCACGAGVWLRGMLV